jgi:hypothetical protein
MSADSLLPNKRPAVKDRRSGQDRRRKPSLTRRITPFLNQPLSDVIDSPQQVVNRLLAIREAHLSWTDVDVTYCTDDELRLCMVRVLAHARADELSEKEMQTFWSVKAEMDRREYHPPLSGGNA